MILPPTGTGPSSSEASPSLFGIVNDPLHLSLWRLRESEVLGVERFNPPDTRVRELVPCHVDPLINLLSLIIAMHHSVDSSDDATRLAQLIGYRDALDYAARRFADQLLTDLAATLVTDDADVDDADVDDAEEVTGGGAASSGDA